MDGPQNEMEAREAEVETGLALPPWTPEETIDAFEAEPFPNAVMDDARFEACAAFRRDEWESNYSHVSDWERAPPQFFQAPCDAPFLRHIAARNKAPLDAFSAHFGQAFDSALLLALAHSLLL